MSIFSKAVTTASSLLRVLREKSSRSFIPFALMLGLTAFLARFSLTWRDIDRGMIVRELSTEPIRLASNLFFGKMTAIGQLTIALMGATWALLIIQESRVKISGTAVFICFTIANVSFLCSLLAYNFGYDFIVARIFHHSAFDIDAPFVNFVKSYQQNFFIYGCLALVSTIFLGRQAK